MGDAIIQPVGKVPSDQNLYSLQVSLLHSFSKISESRKLYLWF